MYSKLSAEETLTQLGSNLQRGLSDEEAGKRLQKYGLNRLQEQKKKSILVLFLEQLNNPLIYILMVAIVISFFLGEAGDAAIIATVIVLNSTVGIIQEGKARKAIEALQKLTSPKALVRRNGSEYEINSNELTIGDIVLLEAGRQVPADLRLLSVINLKIEESALTGESIPVEKTHGVLEGEEGGIGDRVNMAYMSTEVVYGRGEGVVTAIGMQTEIGRIAGLIEGKTEEMTPLQKRLADLGKIISVLSVGICALLFFVAILQKRDVGDMLLTAISLAVAAVPEGLAAIVTIVLALSVSRMVKVGTIVRRLPSVETLGAVTTVCSDKTGTLTANRMTVQECYVDGQLRATDQLDAEKHLEFLRACVLCNDAVIEDKRLGDPTELALLDLGTKYGLKKNKLTAEFVRIGELAFDSERRRMTTVHKAGKNQMSYCKGAGDEILPRCKNIRIYGKEMPFTAKARIEIQAAMENMASRALRVLAVSMKQKGNLTDEENMTFLGLIGMIDPPRPEAAQAVQSFKGAHVNTVMITGDHADTAYAVAKKLGIANSKQECITGAELDAMSEQDFADRLTQTHVFARVSPEHKVRIVRALKQTNQVVAMTGDGINDAPSLKEADVGIAMGKGGTDVARNAADLILTDDNFATIEKAMREGRGIYENIRKSILFLLSSNFGEIITMLAAVLAGFPTPLKASHILWINLITDSLPALALGVDQNDGETLMKQPPRKSTDNMFGHGGLTCTLCYGLVIGSISLLAFLTIPYMELCTKNLPITITNMTKMLQLDLILNKAQTHAFTVLGMSQLVHAVGMRDVNKSVFKMSHFENKYMLVAWGIGILLQVLVTEVPYFIHLFGTSQLNLTEWCVLGILSFMPLAVHELFILYTGLGRKNPDISKSKPTSETSGFNS